MGLKARKGHKRDNSPAFRPSLAKVESLRLVLASEDRDVDVALGMLLDIT